MTALTLRGDVISDDLQAHARRHVTRMYRRLRAEGMRPRQAIEGVAATEALLLASAAQHGRVNRASVAVLVVTGEWLTAVSRFESRQLRHLLSTLPTTAVSA